MFKGIAFYTSYAYKYHHDETNVLIKISFHIKTNKYGL